MKLIVIPPYRREGVNYDAKEGHFFVRELLAIMKEKGQLTGVEVDIDEAHPTDHSTENRDEEVLANISVGFIKRVRKICELGKYDAIVSQASIEPGLFGARMISNIPIAYATHSAVHFASLIGDRFTILTATDAQAQIIRHFVQLYGLSHKTTKIFCTFNTFNFRYS